MFTPVSILTRSLYTGSMGLEIKMEWAIYLSNTCMELGSVFSSEPVRQVAKLYIVSNHVPRVSLRGYAVNNALACQLIDMEAQVAGG